MGASNVMLAHLRWDLVLSHRCARALSWMALQSLDKDDPPLYWGGRDALARAIGYDVPAEPYSSDTSEGARRARADRKAAHKAVAKVVAELSEAGAIERLRSGAPGRQAEYALRLSPSETVPRHGVPTEGAQDPLESPVSALPDADSRLTDTPREGVPRFPLTSPLVPPHGGSGIPLTGTPRRTTGVGGIQTGRTSPPNVTSPARNPDTLEEERSRQSKELMEREKQYQAGLLQYQFPTSDEALTSH